MADLTEKQLFRRYSRPEALAVRTLADLIRDEYLVSMAVILPNFDPDIREVLPNLGSDILSSKERRMDRLTAQVAGAMHRIGKPVCVYCPENYAIGPFLVYRFPDRQDRDYEENAAGEPLLSVHTFHFDQLGYEGTFDLADCVSAYHYAPDGTPLARD